MVKYIIGIVEDDDSQTRDIRRTIKALKGDKTEVDFINYDFKDVEQDISYNLIKQILDDINNEKIHSLIIDYKLLTYKNCMNGADIIKTIKAMFYEFPMIILTQMPEQCIEETDLDPDKVYEKSIFFNACCEESKKYVFNIFRNIDRYWENVRNYTSKLETLRVQKNTDNQDESDVLGRIIDIEKELSRYKPIGHSEMNEILSDEKLKQLSELIEKAKELADD